MENAMDKNQDATKGVTLFSNSLKYGLITGGGYILISLLFYTLDVDQTSWLQYLTFLVLIAGIVWGIIQFRDKNSGGYLSYGRCLSTGVLISVVVGIIIALYIYLFFTYFDASQMQKMADIAEQKFVDQGLSDEDIDKSMEIAQKFMKPLFTAVMSLFSMAFWGTIISLIVSIFLKKDNDSFEGAFTEEPNVK